MCKEELLTGKHKPLYDFPWILAEGFYHTLKQLKEEFIHQKLIHLNIYAVEGIAWLDKDYFSNMLLPKRQKILQDLLQLTESNDYLLPFSPYMMISAKNKYNMNNKAI